MVPLVARHLCREDGRDFIIDLYFLHYGTFNIDTVEGEALSQMDISHGPTRCATPVLILYEPTVLHD